MTCFYAYIRLYWEKVSVCFYSYIIRNKNTVAKLERLSKLFHYHAILIQISTILRRNDYSIVTINQ